MRNRRIILIGIVVAALALIALRYQGPVNDPVYQGRTLSNWLQSEAFKAGGFSLLGGMELPPEPGIRPESADPQALEAISKYGTNALPLLVRMLGTKKSWIEPWLQRAADKNAFIRKSVRPPNNIVFIRQIGAVSAFYRLGPQAAPALPDILPLLNDRHCALAATFAVMYIRPEHEKDILSLTNVLRVRSNRGPGDFQFLHSAAILVLSTFGEKASGAVPILLNQMSSTDESVRAAAAVALARIGASPEKAVPLILQNLPTTNPLPPTVSGPSQVHQILMGGRCLAMNAWALSQYGSQARVALPTLSNLVDHPWTDVSAEAQIAIRKITAIAKDVSQ